MDASIGSGTVIMAGSVINAGIEIGKGVIVNTLSSIEHDCKVSDYCHIAVGAHLCGTVEIGKSTWIGAGAVVVNDITVSGTYVGVPARRI